METHRIKNSTTGIICYPATGQIEGGDGCNPHRPRHSILLSTAHLAHLRSLHLILEGGYDRSCSLLYRKPQARVNIKSHMKRRVRSSRHPCWHATPALVARVVRLTAQGSCTSLENKTLKIFLWRNLCDLIVGWILEVLYWRTRGKSIFYKFSN